MFRRDIFHSTSLWKLRLAGIFFFVLISQTSLLADSALKPGRLRCENRQNPLGIDVSQPRFDFTFESSINDQSPSGYEILVSDELPALGRGEGNYWSSGKITHMEFNSAVYEGKPLRSLRRYYWKLRVYNAAGIASDWSPPQWFETAFLHPEEWKAQWIGDGRTQPKTEAEYYGDDRMPLFRKSFTAKGKPVAARLYVSGLGYYEAYLNGKKIGDHVLDPGFTTYKKQVQYAVYDLTPMINRGENVIGIMSGNGWFNPLPFKLFGRWDLRDYQQTGRPCVKAQLLLRYADGSEMMVGTGADWQTAPGPVTRNNIYLGEYYDARLEQDRWCLPGAAAANWQPAVLVQGPEGMLTEQRQPPIRVTKILTAVRILEAGRDTFLIDLGQNIAGVAQISVSGKAGTQVRLRYGEALLEDGRLNYLTTCATQIKKGAIRGGPGCPETAWQEDVYTLKGNGRETWAPRFTFHGFRYIEVTGWPGKPAIGDLVGLRMNSDLEPNGQFSCSNELFNKIHEAIQYTFLSNVFSVQSDCPGREKMGYGGDMVATANAFLFNYDMQEFYRKAINDFANEQRPGGGITEIAPFTGIADRGYGDDSGPLGWQLAFPYLQMQLYRFYGDRQVIASYYPALKRQMDFLASQSRGNLFYWDISDHEALDPKPEGLSASAFYFHHALLAAEFARVLNIPADAAKYDRLAKHIREAIVERYLVPGTGRFDNATQSAQCFALWYDLSPEPELSLKRLMEEIARKQMHLSTGIFTTKMIFDVLSRYNLNQEAYQIVNQKTFPGWGYMIDSGATTLWETWAYPESGPSQNHPMFGSVDEWFYRSLLGFNDAAPGFTTIVLKPQPAGDLHWAKGSYRSVRGLISSSWQIRGNKFIYDVDIPPGVQAMIWMPSADGKLSDGEKSLNPTRVEAGYTILATGSGHYHYVTNINP